MYRLHDQERMCHPVVLDIHDPSRISRTIAPVDPKPTAVLEEEKVSRFAPKEKNSVLEEISILGAISVFGN